MSMGVPIPTDPLSVRVTLATCWRKMDTRANAEAFSTKPVAGSPPLAGRLVTLKKISSVNG